MKTAALIVEEKAKCHCIFKHPANESEREYLSDRLRYFRSIGDMQGVTIVLAQLTTKCHSV